jgi:putative transcriptional regulator
MDPRTYERLLEAARRLRRRRLERLARLGLVRPARVARADPAANAALDVRKIRAVTGLSQAKFAELLSIEVATLRNWEQGRREPTGPARALLRAIRNDPYAVIKALSE